MLTSAGRVASLPTSVFEQHQREAVRRWREAPDSRYLIGVVWVYNWVLGAQDSPITGQADSGPAALARELDAATQAMHLDGGLDGMFVLGVLNTLRWLLGHRGARPPVRLAS